MFEPINYRIYSTYYLVNIHHFHRQTTVISLLQNKVSARFVVSLYSEINTSTRRNQQFAKSLISEIIPINKITKFNQKIKSVKRQSPLEHL